MNSERAILPPNDSIICTVIYMNRTEHISDLTVMYLFIICLHRWYLLRPAPSPDEAGIQVDCLLRSSETAVSSPGPTTASCLHQQSLLLLTRSCCIFR